MKKIIGIFVMMLLIVTAFLPLGITADENVIDSCDCEIKYFGKSQLSEPIYLKDTSQKPMIIGTPDYFSWKDYEGEDWTTPAKNQVVPKYCGSCWIFASVSILESVINIKEGSAVIDPDLSEQYVLSCLPESGNGCYGGMPYDVFPYIIDTSPSGNNCNGIIWETCFPYQADDTIPCDEKCPEWEDYLVPISDYGYWITNESNQSLEEIKIQIMQGGPVVACILSNNDFGNWGYNNHDPNDYYPFYEGENGVDHDITVLGWKDDPLISNGGYWICKNSWGTDWGYDGFFNMEYGLLGSLWIDDDPDTTYIVWVDYDRNGFYWFNEPDSPGPTSIKGPEEGIPDIDYEYVFNSEDPNGDQVKYHIDWGDGDSETTSLNPSGTDIEVLHSWVEQETYIITVKAEDENGLLGPENTLEIIIPRTRSTFNSLFYWIFEYFPLLERLQTFLLL